MGWLARRGTTPAVLHDGSKSDGRLGAHLRKARLAARLTQTALARAAKLPRLRVVRAETGRYTLDLDEATRVAKVLRIPLLAPYERPLEAG